ncbi:MAG: hypothetical protein LBS16_01360 [Prevotellaceae bacterium]|jgi:hypothetical protein|nr:hypothetical protein [Prevotellaceae bacterium]
MRSEALKDFIREHAVLFWYSPDDKAETVSDELLVETILNYGDMDAVRKLFELMGIKKVASIFFNTINKSERCKNNYHELTLNYFTLLFNRYAQ